jgi:hypothetical protein
MAWGSPHVKPQHPPMWGSRALVHSSTFKQCFVWYDFFVRALQRSPMRKLAYMAWWWPPMLNPTVLPCCERGNVPRGLSRSGHVPRHVWGFADLFETTVFVYKTSSRATPRSFELWYEINIFCCVIRGSLSAALRGTFWGQRRIGYQPGGEVICLAWFIFLKYDLRWIPRGL